MQHPRALQTLAAYLFAFSATAVMPACEKGFHATQPPMKKQSDNGAKQGGSWVPGPSVHSSSLLLTWLAKNAKTAHGKRQRVRIPVVVFFDDYRLDVSGAFLGVSPDDPNDIALVLDDSALGISLVERLRERCPADQPSCVIWVEGYWGPLVDIPADPTPPPYPFAVLGVLAAVHEHSTGDINVLLEP